MLTLCSLELRAVDGSLEFDPELAQRVEVPNFAGLGIANEVTVEFWALYTNASISQPVFILNPDVLTNRFQARLNHINGNTYWDFGDSNNGGRVFSSYPTDAVGIWTHFAFVASKSGSFMKIYANGKLVANVNSSTVLEDVGSTKLNIGGTLGSYFQGKIDDFRVWNVARTEVEIQRDLSGPLSGSEPGLRLYFKFDESNGSTVAINSAVASGAFYNGTIFGNPTFSNPARTTYFVTNTNDSGAGSLRQAFSSGNTEDGPALIRFDSSLDGSTITLSSGLAVLTSGGVTVDASNLLTGLTVSGGGGEYSVFSVNYVSSVLNLRGLTLTGGKSALFNSGIAKISECILTGNSNTTGGAIVNISATLEMTQCTLSGNYASLEGGAISNTFGRITLTGCTLSGNSSFFSGGAINNKGGTLEIKNSTFTDNSAINGIGGAIANTSGLTALTHCTVTNNSADVSSGGGIANNGSLELTNCIVTGNTSPSIPDVNGDNAILSGVNFIGDLANSGLSAGAALLTTAQNGAIRLGPLVSNGGSTKTMALLLGSPAIDVATVISGLETDQRNFSRSRDGNAAVGSLPDIGAYELQTAPTVGNSNPILVTTSNDELNDNGTLGSGVSLREAVRDAPHGAIITFDPQLDGQTLTLVTALGGQIVIEKNLTLDATTLPSGVTISGGDSSRIFSVNGNQSFSLRGVTLKNGRAISGGALCNDGGTLFLSQCTLSENFSSNHGGAIYNSSMGILTLSQCTLSGNFATFQGGAIFNQGTLTVNHSTIANNLADNGGGIYSGSSTDNITLINSIIARNIIIAGSGSDVFNDGATITTNGRNLIGDLIDSGLSADPNLLTGDAKLASLLTSNGGSTYTIPLLPDSPAKEAALGSTITTDQRGFPIVATADLGAYESSIINPIPTHGTTNIFSLPTLSWTGPTGSSYTVFLGSTSGSLTALSTPSPSNLNSYVLATPLAQGTYFWRVDATVGGRTIIGPEFTFTVQGVSSALDNGGLLTLRQRLADAAAHPGPDVILLDASLNGQTLLLTSGLIINDPDGVTIDASDLPSGIKITNRNNANHVLLNLAVSSTLTVKGITFDDGDNLAIFNSGMLTLCQCTFSRRRNGAINNNGGMLNMSKCTVVRNSNYLSGGAIINNGGALLLTQCTICNNSSNFVGGAIYNDRGSLTLTHCTFSDNSATGGGAVYNSGGILTLNNSIVNWNSPVDIYNGGSNASFTRIGVNLVKRYSNANGVIDSGPLPITAAPELAPLGNYGGPNATRPPLPGSPAIDQASLLNSALTTDQRGLPRPLGIRPDLGAVEASIIVVTTPVDELDPPGSPGNGVSLREAVRDLPAGGAIDFDRAIFGGATAYTLTLTQGPLNPPRNGFLFNSANPNGIRIGYVATFTQQPQSQSVAQGATATFSVGVANLSGGLAYDWRKNGFGEAISPSLSISNAQESNEGVYHVVLSEAFSPGSVVPANFVIFPVSITPFTATSQPASLVVDGAPVTIRQITAQTVAPLGSSQRLSVVAVGPGTPPLTYQWSLKGKRISGATQSTYSIPKLALSHAGSYSCVVKSGLTEASATTELAVVDTTPKVLNLKSNTPFTAKVIAAGNGLAYSWKKDGAPFFNLTVPTFTIGLTGIDNNGLFTCHVSFQSGGGNTLTTGFNTRLNVSDAAPVLATPLVLLPAYIGQNYFYRLPVVGTSGAAAASFSVTGALPKGVVFNRTTGVLSGRPTVTKSAGYPLSFRASNPSGSSAAVAATLTVNVVPPTAVGVFAGPLERSLLNGNLGGRFNLTTTATGLCSGSITLGARKAIRFTNQFLLSAGEGDVILRANIPGITFADKTPLTAYVEIFASDQTARLTLVHRDGNTLLASAWRNPWSKTKKAIAFAATYTARLDPEDLGSAPRGYGFATLIVKTDGTQSLTGKLPDGSGVTQAGFVGPEGQLTLFNLLYAKRGSLVGPMQITSGSSVANNTLGATLSWFKPSPLPKSTDTVYQAGFGPLNVTVEGSPYAAPAKGQRVIGLGTSPNPNAKLDFTLGGLAPEFAQLLYISNPSATGLTNKGTLTLPLTNASKLTKLDAAKGRFTGSFVINGATKALNRPALFEGLIVKIGATTQGYGFFLLPTVTAKISTSPKLSGRVVLSVP